LAPHTVRFAFDQIWWEFGELRASEFFPLCLPFWYGNLDIRAFALWKNIDQIDALDPSTLWRSMVSHYSALVLSTASDKLSAFAGIASAFAHRFNIPLNSYLAGLWRNNLKLGLLWCAGKPGHRANFYLALSWSWASFNGKVYCDRWRSALVPSGWYVIKV
jgi:hypothetical protein